ncbi:hypothetical protein [Clostridium sp.]|uniref:hypothetical protein n=1 Tax=Clostridium sp. TaxID=1506 RepID=UPI002636F22C|nr:hypothetical protein [Clostridium sp.]
MSSSNERNQKILALNEALSMLQQNYKSLKIINNSSHYEINQDNENTGKPLVHIVVDIVGEFNNIKFETADYNFIGVNFNDSLDIYIRFKERYILPLLEGFNTYEECELSKFSEEEQWEMYFN